MECYLLSRPVGEERKLVRGYRRRMHHIWKEQYATEITEQRLRDQARMIKKNEWITKVELENIRKKVLQKEKDIEVNNNDNTGEQFYGRRKKRICTRTNPPRLIQRIWRRGKTMIQGIRFDERQQ